MAAKLVNESLSEDIFKDYLRARTESDQVFYHCRQTYGYYKTHFVEFRELIFKQNLVVIKDGEQHLIVENLSKGNDINKTLIVRSMIGTCDFMKEATELLKRLFAGRGIGKIKLLCSTKEIEKDIDAIEQIGFVKELDYSVGEGTRIHMGFFFE